MSRRDLGEENWIQCAIFLADTTASWMEHQRTHADNTLIYPTCEECFVLKLDMMNALHIYEEAAERIGYKIN